MHARNTFLGLIIGGFVGAIAGNFVVAAIVGAVLGQLLGRVGELERRLRQLDASSRKARQQDLGLEKTPIIAETPVPDHPWFEVDESNLVPPLQATETGLTTDPEQKALDEEPRSSWQTPADVRSPSLPDHLQSLLTKATNWFTTGNVPVKVGVIISFFGVAFLLKYAIDRQLLVIPLVFRLLAVAAAGVTMIFLGWRLRRKMAVYALSLQGGGVGILYLTIFSALRIWQLLPAPLAFFLLIALTIFIAALAVLQNSKIFAILGIVGGFLAPILTSTGQGSHVALFSYYLLLNAGILGISWYKAWRGLNLVGFVFTFLLGSIWGYQYYKPALFASTEPFLILYFLFYQAIAILYALRQPPERLGLVDGTLVFGTPAIVFALQAALLENSEYGLAISAASVALFYVLLAYWLIRSKGAYLRLLSESYIALAVAFATIAIPLAVDARWTSAAWALEGAALVWVATRQRRYLAGLAGVGLIFFSGAALIEYGWQSHSGLAFLNGNFLGGMLLSISAFFASRRLDNFDAPDFTRSRKLLSTLLFLWAVYWWLGTSFLEIIDWNTHFDDAQQLLIFLSLSVAAGTWLGHTRQWSKLRKSTFIFLPMLVLPAVSSWFVEQHVLFSLGWLAWPLAWLIQGFVLKMMDEYEEHLAATWHFASLLLLSILLAVDAYWWIDQIASGAWAGAVATAVPGMMALLVWRLRSATRWPVSMHSWVYHCATIVLVISQVIFLALLSITNPGDADPLPYIPVLNPFDLGLLFALLISVFSLSEVRRETPTTDYHWRWLKLYRLMLVAAFFVMTTFALVRGVHQYTDVSWNNQALFRSDIVQTSLSIYWGLLGFAGMIWGSLSDRRTVWLAGAGFMALVVIKLFLVDLGNTGTVERIISFIGIGLLLLVVGYFAPAPPRQAKQKDDG